jgi:drug/metabolite transporter (DMT)-like permease
LAKEAEEFSIPHLVAIMLLRSFLSFGTILTFTWCTLKGNPLLIWPILNMTPLVATAASHLILKEKVSSSEQFALIGFFLGTSLTLVL